jgi:alpha-galactosidase/6-phospho-beta-glucosidase family protein
MSPIPGQPIELKIAYIGGGSREWARKLMFDLALYPDLTGEVALYDIDTVSARLNEALGNWLQGQPGVRSSWRYAAVERLDDALLGADFVVLSIQPGTLECMAEEIAIAERHGIFFPVGDTTGAPGLVRGLRAATIYAGFAEAIDAICPRAWVINYTNPMTICTRTLTRVAPRLKAFGCCHEVFATQHMLAGLVSRYLPVAATPARDEIRVNVTGINHFTWVDRGFYQDVDLLELLQRHICEPDVLRPYTREEVESWNDWFHSADQVKFALLQRFGLLAAAGDRHLVEFLPGFTRSPEELFRWGVIRTPVAWRIRRWQDAPGKTRDLMSGREPLRLESSGEEGVGQLRALLGLGDLVTNVNTANRGQVGNLPLDAVVETNAHFSRDEVRPLAAGPLPAGLQPEITRHVANQELIVEAALARDRDLAFQAILGDPTTRLPVDEAWAMFLEMLQASREFLPGWKTE